MENEADKQQDAAYTFTLTVARKGPGIASKEAWIDFKRTLQTRHLILAAIGMVALFFILILADRFYAPRPISGIAEPVSPKIGSTLNSVTDDQAVITPLNARDPTSLVIPPSSESSKADHKKR